MTTRTPDTDNTANRIGWLGLATIWFGGIISVPALLIGSLLISGLPFWQAMTYGFIGFAVVAVVMSLLGYRAAQTRQDTVSLAARAFGSQGAQWVIGLIVGIPLLGWFGVQTGIAGASMARIVELSFGLKWPVGTVSLAMGLLMMSTAVFGFKALKLLNYVAVPCKVLLVAFGVATAFQTQTFDAITSYRPQPGNALDPLTAIGLAIGFIAVAGVIAPDYSRNVRTPRDAVFGALLGLLPSATLLAACGAMLAVLQHTHDIVDIYAKLGFPLLALSVLIVATWTVNVINIYSAGLAFNGLAGGHERHRAPVTLLAGMAGTVLAAAGVLNSLMSFLSTLTLTVMPIAGVLIVAWYLPQEHPAPARWRAAGLLAWVVGAGGSLLLVHPSRNLVGPVIAGLVFAGLTSRWSTAAWKRGTGATPS